MRIVVGNAKGGVGKSTTAIYLAVGLARTGRRVLLVDGDATNASIVDWQAAAGDEWPASVVVVGWNTPESLRQIEHVGVDYDDVVIDTGPERLDLLRRAMLIADELLVPVTPSPTELRQLGVTFTAAAEVDTISPITARVLLTRVRPGARSGAEAREYLESLDLPTMAAEVRLRESIPQHWGSADFPLGDYEAVLTELLTEMSLT